ncbi:MAG: hypothetical protein H0X63_00260 [Flavobacteriales bacterium]|nr:hypothetical protein [Flavobacteriales bacterium]
MKTTVLSIFVFFLSLSLFSQVGINTTTPSPAAVLDINSSNDGTNFGGLMPPKVTIAQRDLIPVTPADDGLLVYVTDGVNRYLQIYDGVDGVWRTIYPATLEFSAVLAGWNMTGLSAYGLSPFSATTTSSSVFVTGLTRGSGLTTTGTAGANAWGGNGFDSASQPEAITANKFATLTINPSFGVVISLTTIEPYNIRRSPTGPILGVWQYSVDGINFSDIGSPISWGDVTLPAGNPHPAISLSGIPALQNLTSTTTVTFRIVNWGGTASGGNWYINQVGAGNDLIIRGNIN